MRAADTAGFSRVTPAALAEIDRVVAEGTRAGADVGPYTGQGEP